MLGRWIGSDVLEKLCLFCGLAAQKHRFDCFSFNARFDLLKWQVDLFGKCHLETLATGKPWDIVLLVSLKPQMLLMLHFCCKRKANDTILGLLCVFLDHTGQLLAVLLAHQGRYRRCIDIYEAVVRNAFTRYVQPFAAKKTERTRNPPLSRWQLAKLSRGMLFWFSVGWHTNPLRDATDPKTSFQSKDKPFKAGV